MRNALEGFDLNGDAQTETLQRALGEELTRILEDSYGTTAGSTRVVLDDDAVIVFMDDLELQRLEEFLIEHGEADIVIANRTAFQQGIESTFRAAVERIIGRQVVSFASITKLQPNYAVEIFRLGPKAAREDDPRAAGS
jgi:uncharacterized protein YbcI